MQNQMNIAFQRILKANRLSHVCAVKLSSKSPRVAVTDDGQTIVCHHPEVKHPYEDTLPYTDSANVKSIFKLSNIHRGENLYIHSGAASLEDIQALTYTNKHAWQRRRFDGLQMTPSHPRKGV